MQVNELLRPNTNIYNTYVKLKLTHYRPLRPLRVQEDEAPSMWQSCQLYAWAAFTPQETYLVLIYVGVSPDLTAWGLSQLKIPMTPSGIETATFRLDAQCLNQLRHLVWAGVRKRLKRVNNIGRKIV